MTALSIYIDRVFVLNLAVDYLLLMAVARLAGTPLRRLRFLLCGAGGGLYAAAVFFPSLTWLASWPWVPAWPGQPSGGSGTR